MIDSTTTYSSDIPLVVDIDGTLVRSDLLVESAFGFVSSNPLRIFEIPGLLLAGKAALKAGLAESVDIDVSRLPYDPNVLEIISQAKLHGRKVYLASASNEKYVSAIAKHLDLDGWFASDKRRNLVSQAKAERLSEVFGGDFEYLGNDTADLAVWAVSRSGLAVHPSSSVKRAIDSRSLNVTFIERPKDEIKYWFKLLRVHQWAKNSLVFLPVLAAHEFTVQSYFFALLTFIAFSFAASAIYILNDLVDLEADRNHPTKKKRPLAAGTVPPVKAIMVGFCLGVGALLLAFSINWLFLVTIVFYLFLTTAYSFSLKRKMLVDVVTLAGLYTVRVLGGAAATSISVSEWLLGFSLFTFTALALIKRYV